MEIVANQNNTKASVQNQPLSPAVSQDKNVGQGVEQVTDIVMFSEQSMMHSQVDELYQQLDSIYLSHLSAADKKSLEKAYGELDKIFQVEQPTEAQDKQAEKLFGQIDQIFTDAESALTTEDKKRIDVLNDKIDVLFEEYEADIMDEFPDELLVELDPLEQELDAILSSTLSAEQKNELNKLHSQIGRLFEQTERSEQSSKAIETAFDKIDGILNKSYENLSDANKERVQVLESNIDEVFDAMANHNEKHSEQLSGYYPV